MVRGKGGKGREEEVQGLYFLRFSFGHFPLPSLSHFSFFPYVLYNTLFCTHAGAIDL